MIGVMFDGIYSGKYPTSTEPDSSYFIDRDGTHFQDILNYMRNDYLELKYKTDLLYLYELQQEADFYNLISLSELIQPQIDKLEKGI